MNALGVDWLSFGSECGNIDGLRKAANALLSPSLRDSMQIELKTASHLQKPDKSGFKSVR